MKRLIVVGVLVAVGLLMVLIQPGQAAFSSAVLGTEDFMAGALPPPGFHYINYVWYYQANKMLDNSGNDVSSPGFKAWSIANVFRPIYVAPVTILGANPAWHAVIPLAYRQVKSDVYDFTAKGIGDAYVSPLILGWHWPKAHLIAGLDVIMPTGQYDENNYMKTLGNNHWTFEPAVAGTAILPAGFMANAKLMYDFHTKNPDFMAAADDDLVMRKHDYQTGQAFHADYCVDYGLLQNLRLGIAGFYLKSTTEDKFDDTNQPDSKEQLFAIGPAISYAPMERLNLSFKWLAEAAARNHTEGNNLWFKLVYSF